jgi:hypothetical protein
VPGGLAEEETRIVERTPRTSPLTRHSKFYCFFRFSPPGPVSPRRPPAGRYYPWEPTALHEFLSSFSATHNRQHGGYVGAVTRSECQNIVHGEDFFVIQFSPETERLLEATKAGKSCIAVIAPLCFSAIGA